MIEPSGKAPWLAAGIGLAWLLSLILCLALDLSRIHPLLVVVAVLVRTFLQTGLFIVGHDAMHRLLLPMRPRLNHQLGALALGLYGALPYQTCLLNHHRHHRAPGSDRDPDGHGDHTDSLFSWYRRFMAGYLSWRQMAGLLSGWGLLAFAVGGQSPTSGITKVLLFCTLPLLLSSWQLFLVGTYLPHRRQSTLACAHQVVSLDWPVWVSLLACYHFGYHREHHQSPELCWFQLPMAHGNQQQRPLAPLIFAR